MKEDKILTVAQFIRFIKNVIRQYPVVVQGEVTELGIGEWVSMTIKDPKEGDAVRVFGLGRQITNALDLKIGILVKVTGVPSVSKKGSFGIFASEIVPFGEGELLAAYGKLKAKLESEGLFTRKRPLLPIPERILLLTAEGSDGYNDFITNLKRRRSDILVNFYSINVQGIKAAPSIVGAFTWVKANPKIADAVVLTRGGGSLEDIYAFNTEEVARAVFSSPIPVISAIGHERHTPLTDFVADDRASNPQDAAVVATPVTTSDALIRVNDLATKSEEELIDTLEGLNGRVGHSTVVFERYFELPRAKLIQLGSRIRMWPEKLTAANERLGSLERLVKSFEYGSTLKRGFSVTKVNGHILKNADGIKKGQILLTELNKGRITSEVK